MIPGWMQTLVNAQLAARSDDTVTLIELAFNLGLPLVLFILGWVVGGRRERAHLRDLTRREARRLETLEPEVAEGDITSGGSDTAVVALLRLAELGSLG